MDTKKKKKKRTIQLNNQATFYKFVHGRFGGEEKIGHKFTFLVIEELNCHIKYSIKIVC